MLKGPEHKMVASFAASESIQPGLLFFGDFFIRLEYFHHLCGHLVLRRVTEGSFEGISVVFFELFED